MDISYKIISILNKGNAVYLKRIKICITKTFIDIKSHASCMEL